MEEEKSYFNKAASWLNKKRKSVNSAVKSAPGKAFNAATLGKGAAPAQDLGSLMGEVYNSVTGKKKEK
jgi:hypothetical protein